MKRMVKMVTVAVLGASVLFGVESAKAQSNSQRLPVNPVPISAPATPVSVAPESNSLLLFAFAGAGCLVFFGGVQRLKSRNARLSE